MITDYTKQIGKKIALNSHYIDISEIIYISCDSYICTIYLKDEKISISKQLKCFENELSEFGFIRINRSTIINLFHFTLIRKF